MNNRDGVSSVICWALAIQSDFIIVHLLHHSANSCIKHAKSTQTHERRKVSSQSCNAAMIMETGESLQTVVKNNSRWRLLERINIQSRANTIIYSQLCVLFVFRQIAGCQYCVMTTAITHNIAIINSIPVQSKCSHHMLDQK